MKFAHMVEELDRECTNVNRPAPLWHQHVHLVNQRAHHARFYTAKLVAAIIRGCRTPLAWTGEMNNFHYPVPEDPVIPREPEMSEELESYWDDANGGYLNPRLRRYHELRSKAARKEEGAR